MLIPFEDNEYTDLEMGVEGEDDPDGEEECDELGEEEDVD